MASKTLEKKYCYEELKQHLQQYMALHRDFERYAQEEQHLRMKSNHLLGAFLYLAKDSGTAHVLSKSLKNFAQEMKADLDIEDGMQVLYYYLESLIVKLEDETLQSILKYRYLDKLPWLTVMKEMNYSWSQIHRLHNNALHRLVDVIHDT